LKKIFIISVGVAVTAIAVIIFVFVAPFPTQDYAVSVDPVVSTGDFGTYTHVIIKNTGRQPVTNVKVDYGSQVKPDLIPIIEPGDRIMLSPPDGSDLSQVKVTADNDINVVKLYRNLSGTIGNSSSG